MIREAPSLSVWAESALYQSASMTYGAGGRPLARTSQILCLKKSNQLTTLFRSNPERNCCRKSRRLSFSKAGMDCGLNSTKFGLADQTRLLGTVSKHNPKISLDHRQM